MKTWPTGGNGSAKQEKKFSGERKKETEDAAKKKKSETNPSLRDDACAGAKCYFHFKNFKTRTRNNATTLWIKRTFGQQRIANLYGSSSSNTNGKLRTPQGSLSKLISEAGENDRSVLRPRRTMGRIIYPRGFSCEENIGSGPGKGEMGEERKRRRRHLNQMNVRSREKDAGRRAGQEGGL